GARLDNVRGDDHPPIAMSTLTTTDPKSTILPLLEGSTWPGAAEAFGAASDMPVPGRKSEAWKYTRVSGLFNQHYSTPQGDWAITLPPRPLFEATRVVFVNGHFRADLSDDLKALGKGIVVDTLK